MSKDHAPAIERQSRERRVALAKQFIESVVFRQYRELVAWKTVTGQSSQIDSGYLGQQIVSLLAGVPGTGMRGKGSDLVDGSEVKTASTMSGSDQPRWNNQIGTRARRKSYLQSPNIYFVLFDTVRRDDPFPLRVRIWRVAPSTDAVFRDVVEGWAAKKSSGNFQLHPPNWKATSLATNKAGNIHLPLMFHAQQIEIGDIDYMEVLDVKWRLRRCRRDGD